MKIVSTFLAVVLMVSIASIALARGAPSKEKAFSQATVSVHVAPAVANVPPMTTGYDVICNLTANPRLASAKSVAFIICVGLVAAGGAMAATMMQTNADRVEERIDVALKLPPDSTKSDINKELAKTDAEPKA